MCKKWAKKALQKIFCSNFVVKFSAQKCSNFNRYRQWYFNHSPRFVVIIDKYIENNKKTAQKSNLSDRIIKKSLKSQI